jgi:CubicO group peptidase (beta-lactamase class C family)
VVRTDAEPARLAPLTPPAPMGLRGLWVVAARRCAGAASERGELLLGSPGYTFGFVFAVRPSGGIASVPGSAGEFMWAGYAGTYFWVDPKEEFTAIYMSQAPSPIHAYYRKLVKQLVYGARTD